ncbi:MAG: tetratricopeptide repeat protein [Burkholderiales bacterium]|nr:tetratricopeptide repeat protein [Burkholderiales bacterium]
MAHGPDDAIDLVRGALWIAAEQYPQLDVDAYVRKLDLLGETLRRRLRPDIGRTDSIRSLNRYMYDELGFRGAADDYYDPRNSFLNEVLDRRAGIPITLAIVYMTLGRRLGLPVDGVSFPGHFLVRCPVRDGTVVLDPFHKGVSLGMAELEKRLGSARAPARAQLLALLAPASPREILARLLRNLRAIYLHYRQHSQALVATTRILDLDPGNAGEWRERAGLHLTLECFRAALADFHRCLALAPDAEDAEQIRARVVELQLTCARLN